MTNSERLELHGLISAAMNCYRQGCTRELTTEARARMHELLRLDDDIPCLQRVPESLDPERGIPADESDD